MAVSFNEFFHCTGLYRGIKLALAMRRWGAGRIIRTWSIAKDAELGIGVRLDEDVVVHGGCRIGDRSYMRINSKLWHGSSVGSYCSIGENVLIGTPEHPKHYLSTSPLLYQLATNKPVDSWPSDDVLEPACVGNDVWIGNNVIIRGGVHVGTGSIVGAGSVVTHDVDPYTVVAGVPAKFIGRRFDEELSQALLESCWWELPYEDLLKSEFVFNPSLMLGNRQARKEN